VTQQRTRNNLPAGRGISQQIAEFHVTVKPDYDRIVAALRKFKFPTVYTLDDLLPICGLKTQADRVHLSRALRRAGIAPLRGRKIWLTDIVSGSRLRAYVFEIADSHVKFRTAGDVRREYYRQRHFEKMQLIAQIQQQIASRHA
jgi:hypothetical protein